MPVLSHSLLAHLLSALAQPFGPRLSSLLTLGSVPMAASLLRIILFD